MIKTYFASSIKPADAFTKAFRFVLHDRFGSLSTHMETFDKEGNSDGFHHGHYFQRKGGMEMAVKDLQERMKKAGLVYSAK